MEAYTWWEQFVETPESTRKQHPLKQSSVAASDVTLRAQMVPVTSAVTPPPLAGCFCSLHVSVFAMILSLDLDLYKPPLRTTMFPLIIKQLQTCRL